MAGYEVSRRDEMKVATRLSSPKSRHEMPGYRPVVWLGEAPEWRQNPGGEPLWRVTQEPPARFVPVCVRSQIVLNRRLPRRTQSVAGLSAMRESMIVYGRRR